MNSDATVTAAGWRLTVAFAIAAGGDNRESCAVFRGEDFGAPQRGLLLALARGDDRGAAPAEAAQLGLRLFSEGYFGALPTLGAARAMARGLSSANSWIYAQARSDAQRQGMAASLCALACGASKKLIVLHLGENRVYLKRSGQWQLLTLDHSRPLADGVAAVTRALGIDVEAHADLREIEAEPGDRIVLVGAGMWRSLSREKLAALLASDLPPQALAQQFADAASPGSAVLALDVLAAPAPRFDDLAAEYAALPIRQPPQQGDIWDGFEVGRTLYRGRYTLLKRARDTVENRDVVLKLPLPAMAQDSVFHAGFLREAWIGSKMRSRWSVDYLDVSAARRSSLYLVMPFYPGLTLEERLKKTSPPVSLAEGVGVAINLCEAIADLSARQVIHRDIKPENIFLLTSGELKLLDLGLAALPGLDDDARDDFGGTTRYMAPELFKGEAAGPRSEVFSLGVTLYRMFSGGDFPFGRNESRPLARARPDLPAWLGKAIGQAIQLDPSLRFADAASFRRALDHGLAHEDWRGHVPARFGDKARLWRLIALALAICCLVLALWRR
jgi:hypothetical protein